MEIFVCYECGLAIPEEDEVWIDPQTGEATTGDTAAPFHVECAPPQHKESVDADQA